MEAKVPEGGFANVAVGQVLNGPGCGPWVLLNLVALIFLLTGAVVCAPLESRRERIAKIIAQIQRADYEADQAKLNRLYDDLAPFVDDQEFGARVRYWRGFAQWRRAINGFNDSIQPGELEVDLKQAVIEFQEAIKKDPGFADAKAAAGSSMGILMFLYRQYPGIAEEFRDPARVREFLIKALSYMNEAEAAEPSNPRVLWVLGQARWVLPPERGGGQDKAFGTYEKGLKAARVRNGAGRDPLMPSWGEPELLMNLAWANLNRSKPDVAAAEQYAKSALALVPYWHYVRDILLPLIEIVAIERTALDRWGKGDPQGYLEILAPDVTYFDPFQERTLAGMTAVKEYMIPITGKIRIDSYQMITPQLQRYGDVAVLTFNLIDTAKPPDREEKVTFRWNSTEVYRRIDGKWKIIHSHWSFTKPELKQIP